MAGSFVDLINSSQQMRTGIDELNVALIQMAESASSVDQQALSNEKMSKSLEENSHSAGGQVINLKEFLINSKAS